MKLQHALSILPLLAGAFAGAVLLGCSAESSNGDSDTFPETPFTTLTSDHGALVLEVRTAPSQPPERGRTAVDLAITDVAGHPADGLTLSVVPWMPKMGHAAPTEPAIEAMGDGHYKVSDVNLFMAGRWELLTEISGPVSDSAKVVFQIP
jgi:hypothetical protein